MRTLLATALVVLAPALAAGEERKHTDAPLSTVKKLVEDEKAVLLDVREHKEWVRGHVRGAIHVPLSELKTRGSDEAYLAELAARLPKDKTIYVHCASGVRCLLACDILDELDGFEFHALKPGYKDLVASGLESETGDER